MVELIKRRDKRRDLRDSEKRYLDERRERKRETYVEEPPLPEMKLAVVVPVYREFTNGNLFRLIESFEGL
ncbi:MAG: hypothetical protein HYV32_05185 [Candidatus Kerfeldbacteria bacterium]|nr:hypothetical protein [Candidatus Kerfeldbacteria bacterium]